MWPDSKLDKIQVDKHPLGPTHKLTKEKVSQTRLERPYRGRRAMWTDCHMDRLQNGQNSSKQTSRQTECQVDMISNRKSTLLT